MKRSQEGERGGWSKWAREKGDRERVRGDGVSFGSELRRQAMEGTHFYERSLTETDHRLRRPHRRADTH